MVGRYRHAWCKAHIWIQKQGCSEAMQGNMGHHRQKNLDSLCFWIWIFGVLHIYKPFTVARLCTACTIHSPQLEAMVCERQSHVGYSWPCKMLGAQSFPNTGYFWYGPYASWGRESFKAQNINKGWLELFQGRQSDMKRGRVYTCHSIKRQWQMDEEWVAATGNSCTKFPVWMRKQRGKETGRRAGCHLGPDWPRFSSSLVRFTLDTSSFVLCLPF